jgi:hypothetical protein
MEERAKPGFDSAIYFGAAVTAIICLLPYVNVFGLPAIVAGAIAAVFSGVGTVRRPVELKEGAKLGFLAPFFGMLAAAVIVDIIWQFFDYQLWQKQNAAVMLAMFRTFMSPETMDKTTAAFEQAATKPFAWYMILTQIIAAAIFAGIFGTLSGIVSAAATSKRGTRLAGDATPAAL